MSMKNMTFEELEPGMRIFHMEDEDFGEILRVDKEDKDWLMLEVKWDNEDPKVEDVSFVLSGAHIAVVVKPDTELMEKIQEAMGDKLKEVAEEHGEDFAILNIVNPW